MNDEEKYKEIMCYYGFEAQREQLVEELSELIQAVQKCKRKGDKESYEHFKEELADAIIMCTQMYNFVGTDEIDRIIEQKLDRQIQRIRKESE